MTAENHDQPEPVDEAMLRAFARGQLDEAAEDKIVALLEKKPELQAKVAAISIDPVIEKMRAHSQVVARRSLSSQFEKDEKGKADQSGPPAAPPMDIPRELEKLSEFRVIKELGRGGMGVVYLAENKWMRRKEVLKVLNERLVGNAGAKSRFQKEIQITAQLDHPAIVKSHSVRPLESVIVFSMEYVKGKNLHEFISINGKLPVHVACSIASDVCSGLQHAMNKGAIHRDVKPSNIMLYKNDDGQIRAKILDFGLARATNTRQKKWLTEDGTLLGTLEYISPEQSLDANKADIRADIYSLGCTLYHMLVGHPPFTGTPGELILAHSQTPPPSPHLIQPSVPVELANVVARILAKQPDRRYQTPAEVAAAIKPFAHKHAATPLPDTPAEPFAPPETAGLEAEGLCDTSVEMARQAVEGDRSENDEAVHLQQDKNEAHAIPAISTAPTYKARAQRKRRHASRWLTPPYLFGGVVMLTLVACFALSVLEVKTPNGTIVIENLPQEAKVLVDGNEVRVSWRDETAVIQALPGKRRVEVRLGDTIVEGEAVTVQTNAETKLLISSLPAAVADKKTSDVPLKQPMPPHDSDDLLEVAIAGTSDGVPIGDLRKGQEVRIRYLRGEWGNGRRMGNPDQEKGDRNDFMLLLVSPDDKFTRLPPGTSKSPFTFVAEQEGIHKLRMADELRGDNRGTVVYGVSISESKIAGRPLDTPVANPETPSSSIPANTDKPELRQQAKDWIDLLSQVENKKHVIISQLRKLDNGVVNGLSNKDLRFLAPYAIYGDYDLEVEFTRKHGNKDLSLILPVGLTCVELVFSDHDCVIGRVDGKSPRERTQAEQGVYRGDAVVNNRRHKVVVQVRLAESNAQIATSLDGTQLFRWKGDVNRLSLRPAVALPRDDVPGVQTHKEDRVQFHSLRMRSVGEGVGQFLSGDWGQPFRKVLDAPPEEIAAECVYSGEKAYYFSEAPMDLPDARYLAARISGRLLTVSSKEEQTQINMLRSGRKLIMSGWRPDNSFWRDERNRPLQFTKGWEKDQPSNTGRTQRFMVFDNKDGGGWNDLTVVNASRGHFACIEWGEEYPHSDE